MEQGEIRLSTPEEMCKKANSTDSGLHHEEPKRFSFTAYFNKVKENWVAKINLIFRW